MLGPILQLTDANQILSLLPLFIILGIVLVFVGFGMAVLNSGGGGVDSARRNAMKIAALGGVGVLAAESVPEIADELSQDTLAESQNQLLSILHIDSGVTHSIDDNSSETYDGVVWEDGGALVFESNAALQLTDQ